MNWVLDKHNEDGFLKTCQDASENDEAFSKFRDNPYFGLIVENSPLKSGLEYYECIKNEYRWLLRYMDKFITSDEYGSPKTYRIGDWVLSPSTMRYIKTLGDLYKFFGDLDDFNIAEIGAGYGGLCKVINDVFSPNEYVLFDQPSVSSLQCKFLNKFDVYPIPAPHTDYINTKIDLLIAMYSWSELTHELQIEYMNNVMKRSKNLYIMLNYDMEFSYNLIKDNFPAENISDHNLFYDDNNKEYYPHNRFIIIKN